MLVLARVVVSSTFALLHGSGATQTRGMIQNEVQCVRLNLFECEDYFKSLESSLIIYPDSPFECSGVQQKYPLKVKPLAGDLSFA